MGITRAVPAVGVVTMTERGELLAELVAVKALARTDGAAVRVKVAEEEIVLVETLGKLDSELLLPFPSFCCEGFSSILTSALAFIIDVLYLEKKMVCVN